MREMNQFADVTTGVVYIHSSPAALCPHVDWALSATLDSPAKLRWTSQPAYDGLLRATTDWTGPVGTCARLVDSLRAWPMLRFEVTEDPSHGVDGERYSHVPGLGLWRGSTSANGDVVVGEMKLRSIMNSRWRHRRGDRSGDRRTVGRGTRTLPEFRRRCRSDMAAKACQLTEVHPEP